VPPFLDQLQGSAPLRALLASVLEAGGGRAVPAELQLAESLLDAASVALFVLDAERRIAHCNGFLLQLSGYERHELAGRPLSEYCVARECAPSLSPVYERTIRASTSAGSLQLLRAKDGRERILDWSESALRDTAGEVIGQVAIARDLTATVATLEALDTTTQLLEGSFDATTVALAYLDPELRFVRVNRAYAVADNKEPADFVGKGHFELYPHEENERLFQRVREGGEAYSVLAKPFEYASNPERGVTHWDWTLTPVKDAGGDVTGLVLAVRDVTARIKAIEALHTSERRIAEQLEEKEALLREVHHRVKNNLQVVSSLLYLQSNRVDDPEIARLFRESRDRVVAMSAVHETLYGGDDLAHVNFRSYLDRLSRSVLAAYHSEDRQIELEIQVDEPQLGLSQAVPCGLIVTELLTNALKHAFVGRDRGVLRVGLTAVDEATRCLRVSDDGVGMDEAAIASPETLGLSLVQALGEQIQARIELNTDGGTDVRITFAL